MSPLPEDVQLPSGWVCERMCESELVLRHEAGGFEVVAARTDESDLLPFEVNAGWDLACRVRAGESVSEHIIGRVSTRSAAVEALRSCMDRMNALVRTGSTDGLSLTNVVREIQREPGFRSVTHRYTTDG